jgi:WD40 repeat protein
VWDLAAPAGPTCVQTFHADAGSEAWVWAIKASSTYLSSMGDEPGLSHRREAGDRPGSSAAPPRLPTGEPYLGDGNLVLTGSTDGFVRALDIRMRKVAHTVRVRAAPGSASGSSVGWGGPGGDPGAAPIAGMSAMFAHHRFVTASFDGCVRVWDLRTFRPLARYTGGFERMTRCDVSQDMIAAGRMDGTVVAWDMCPERDAYARPGWLPEDDL